MSIGRTKRGMALVAVLAVMSLLAILAVATLSVTSRLGQGSALAVRDGRLESAASYGMATVLLEWRQRMLSQIPGGTTRQAIVVIPGGRDTAVVTITRLSSDLFWIVSDVSAVDGARRRENMVVRLPQARMDTVPTISARGDVRLSQSFVVVPDTGPACKPSAPTLRLAAGSSLTSVAGSIPAIRVDTASPSDSSRIRAVGGVDVTDLTRETDLVVDPGGSMPARGGVVHALGDLTVTGGAGQGILVVEGRLMLSGPVSFTGVIIARGGVVAAVAGSELSGVVIAGRDSAGSPSIDIPHSFVLHPSACTAEAALAAAIVAHLAGGRAWAELY